MAKRKWLCASLRNRSDAGQSGKSGKPSGKDKFAAFAEFGRMFGKKSFCKKMADGSCVPFVFRYNIRKLLWGGETSADFSI